MIITITAMVLTACVFTAFVILLRLICRKRPPHLLFHLLWMVAALMFVIPVRIPSHISIYSIFDYVTLDSSKNAAGQMDRLLVKEQAVSDEQLTVNGGTSIFEVIYFAGVCAGVALLVCLRMIWLIRFRKSERVYLDSIPRLLKSDKQNIRIYKSPFIKTPCISGFMFIRVYFPSDWDFHDDQKVQMTLFHEWAHVVHMGNLRKLVFSLVLCLQWCNPIIWIMYRYATRDMELYADAYVIRHWQEDVRADYANMLLSVCIKSSSNPAVCLGKRVIRERIVSIMEVKKGSLLKNIASAACLVLLVFLLGGFSSSWIYADVMPQDYGYHVANDNSGPEQVIIDYNDEPLRFMNGEFLILADETALEGIINIGFSIVPVEGLDNGQTIEYGYVKDGEFVALGSAKIFDGTMLSIDNAEIGGGGVYIRSCSTDTIYIKAINVLSS